MAPDHCLESARVGDQIKPNILTEFRTQRREFGEAKVVKSVGMNIRKQGETQKRESSKDLQRSLL